MLDSTNGNIVNYLKKYKFQKQSEAYRNGTANNESSSSSSPANVDVESDGSRSSNESLRNLKLAVKSAHVMSDCEEESNSAPPKPSLSAQASDSEGELSVGKENGHLMSDSEENSNPAPPRRVASNDASSDSEDDLSVGKENAHSMSDSEGETPKPVAHNEAASDSELSVGQDPLPPSGTISELEDDDPRVSKKRKIKSSSSSESESDEEPKKYSRIRTLNSFKFKKKRKIHVDGTDDENSIGSESSRSNRGDNTESRDSTEVKMSVVQKVENHPRKKNKKGSGSDEENEAFKEEKVYDSDDEYDSDFELSNEMTRSQTKVFEFFNTATPVELLQIQSCTQNKVNSILEGRPFKSWIDLVIKLKTGKSLGTQLLNSALDALKTRETVSGLMKKCLRIAIETERRIGEGATGIKSQPASLAPHLQLKSYQMVGLNWLAVMHDQGLSGILADEMGLGKTIQVIAFLAHLRDSGQAKGPSLVVAPSSTIENWALEFARWLPDAHAVVYHGSMEERRALRHHWFKKKFEGIDVIITSYSIVSGNYEEKKMFRIVPLQYVIFDEAHMLKNMNTQRYFNLFNIKAEHRILLTGTPLQNNLLELMSLLNFVMPKVFSEKLLYIKAFFSKNAKLPTESLPDFEREQVDLAKRIMKPFVLRRLKDDVLKDLPEKTSEVATCPMTPDQASKYQLLMEEVSEEAAKGALGDHNYISSFMALRRLANHPLACRYLYDVDKLTEMADRLSFDTTYKENNKDHILEDLSFMSDHEIHQLTKNHKCISRFALEDSEFLKSGKFNKLDEVLPKFKEEGHRVIIFSQFVFVLDLLEEYLRIRGHTSIRLDGSTKSLDRQDLIDNYNQDNSIFVFLLTTRAGGMGINLTTADRVIIHDVDFNPYNDKQAEDRCHRLGQTKPVHIMRLISKDTVEEMIYSRAQSKLNLEQELTGQNDDDEAEENKNVEVLLKELLGLGK